MQSVRMEEERTPNARDIQLDIHCCDVVLMPCARYAIKKREKNFFFSTSLVAAAEERETDEDDGGTRQRDKSYDDEKKQVWQKARVCG